MRIIKEADIRKNEILDAAGILFTEKGYENTSVTDIMNAVGIAKGTLYHHYKSKEDILNALIKRQTDDIFLSAKKIADDKSIPVKERMIRTILALHVDTEQMVEQTMMEQLHKPQNTLMHEKTKKIIFHASANITEIINKLNEDTRRANESIENSVSSVDITDAV